MRNAIVDLLFLAVATALLLFVFESAEMIRFMLAVFNLLKENVVAGIVALTILIALRVIAYKPRVHWR